MLLAHALTHDVLQEKCLYPALPCAGTLAVSVIALWSLALLFLPLTAVRTGEFLEAMQVWAGLTAMSVPVAALFSLLTAAVRAPLVFRRDGKMLAVCSNDGTFCLYDVDQGQVRAQCRRHERNVVALTATPDGRSFISAGDDGRIHVWDAESGQLRFDSPDSPQLDAGGPVRETAVAPASHRLATAT